MRERETAVKVLAAQTKTVASWSQAHRPRWPPPGHMHTDQDGRLLRVPTFLSLCCKVCSACWLLKRSCSIWSLAASSSAT